ncbi:hypothetical protein DL766_001724 [Monosporascus sp. MC13-8B]|uniref:SPX domain-containing protein n=1 Tax=Monosporascus cannonballus TaxID=155416 RepID=A0ABY0H5E5_9PEZI|nr:hypothetical protein DL762_005253 [Monosporascus cannonballus]RYO89042.1 hypothetical protein DL763_005796 [Monosporascus cannonballus]RYP36967.1 hypothetical protein DL766_001724 [Monosporascus sp. MC13-8B]
MKFAKELEQELVPEWRIKYLNYKAGKKHVKAVSRAINRIHNSPHGPAKRGDPLPRRPSFFSSPFTPRQRDVEAGQDGLDDGGALRATPAPKPQAKPGHQETPKSGALPTPGQGERHSLARSPGNEGNYGSFGPRPASQTGPPSTSGSRNLFQLPDPAMRVPSNLSEHPSVRSDGGRESLNREAMQRSATMAPVVLNGSSLTPMARSSPASHNRPSSNRLRRLFTATQPITRTESARYEVDMQALDTVRQREKEFFEFLDGELEKVESFYHQKEEQAGLRLAALREQLHEMKNRRVRELACAKHRKEQRNGSSDDGDGKASGHDHPQGLFNPIKSKLFRPGPNSKALSAMPMTPVIGGTEFDARRDYTRKAQSDDVPYRTAKRKLKLALEEFYRGLELLKAYTLLNRTAFRKLNKKYDKATHARPPYRYMNEKVNKAWFVNSDVVDNYIRDVEDLYARYFEKGNHKVAAGKLRRLTRRPGDESGTTFRSGLFIGMGAVFSIQGVAYGAKLLFDDDSTNVELFFCLYSNHWDNPVQCNSNNSRLMGFFSALPPIWRALQCIRRYQDTKNVFPHLVNCGKYCMTIMAAVTLSLYRIDGTYATLGAFITFATINSIYSSIWDLLMDFSLLQPDARNRFLRNLLGLKRRWPYYVIMTVDPILRFGWIFYAIFTHDAQHSTIVSFLVAFSEVIRRGMWALIRVENEHCSNVAAYKASRDLPLPYRLEHEQPGGESASSDEPKTQSTEENAVAGVVDASAAGSSMRAREEAGVAKQPTPVLEAGDGGGGRLGLRRHRSEVPGARSIRGIMAEAHRQDFEKRRPRAESSATARAAGDDDINASEEERDDDDDDDDTASVFDERMEARRAERLVRSDSGDVE